MRNKISGDITKYNVYQTLLKTSFWGLFKTNFYGHFRKLFLFTKYYLFLSKYV